jgi:thioredoxin reductase
MIYDALIIGGGVSGMSCALILGSAIHKPFASDKKIGIIVHQKASSLQSALFNNAYGLHPNTLGSELLIASKDHLSALYPHIEQIENQKVSQIIDGGDFFEILTNKDVIKSKIVVVAIGAAQPLTIKGLESYVIPHQKTNAEKNRIQLMNNDHLVKSGLYVCGTLAGHRSQLSIAAGSGAAVATDILTLWNNGIHVQVHDKI